jgi:hypothetical protein
MQSRRIEESIQFDAEDSAQLAYAMEQTESQCDISIRYRPQEVTVLLSSKAARDWAEGESVGIYGSVAVGEHQLALIVEKDFACLDGSDSENLDTFPNPKAGSTC